MTGNVKSLINFLAARLDEDEAITRRNLGKAGLGDDGDFPDYRTYSDERTAAANDYLTQFAPPRALADVAAKRAILARHTSHTMGQCRTCEAPHWGTLVCNHCHGQEWPCADVRDIAGVYRGDPDWREEWAA